MQAQTIEDIKGTLAGFEEVLESVDLSKFKGQKFGEEHEFTAKSLVVGSRALVTDIRGQIEKPGRLLKLLTMTERRSIAANLNVLRSSLHEEQMSAAAVVLQELKVTLRPFQLRGSPETREQLEVAVEALHLQVAAIKDERRKIADEQARLLELSSAVSVKLDECGTRLKDIDAASTSLGDVLSSASASEAEITQLKEAASLASSAAEESQTSANSNKELIDEFLKKVSVRESQLLDQQVKTDAFTEELTKHRAAMSAIEEDARGIIESARTALSYKTAEGLSAAFNERYNETKSDSQRKIWIIVAGVLVVLAVALGIWITWDTSVTIAVVAGRVSLIPILIAGAWFCAHQYVKLANISEEYAYKSVLSKSIVGFSGQMSRDNDAESDHSHYIRTVLAEIHTNPLRAQGKADAARDKAGEFDGAEKLLKILSEVQKITKQA
ncbi:hypothetical protein [Stenotrophomonas sp.]|uniref:hypothetical protein n=1 Tax=Stenotrophomonas sp. TaxID=69392 RepID=UPI0028B1C790|nr:hypothetical protein [Stenotrophomonas sp.]